MKNQVSEDELVRILGKLRQIQPDQTALRKALQQLPVTSGNLPRFNQRKETFMSKLKFLVPLAAIVAVAIFAIVRNPVSQPASTTALTTTPNTTSASNIANGSVDNAVNALTSDASSDQSVSASETTDPTAYGSTSTDESNIGDSFNENSF